MTSDEVPGFHRQNAWRPAWSQRFIEEPIDIDDVDLKVAYRPAYTALCLSGLCVVGFAIQLVTALTALPAIVPTVLWALAAIVLAVRRPRTASITLLIAFVIIFALQVVYLTLKWPVNLPSRWSSQSTIGILGAISALLSFVASIVIVNMPLRDPVLSRAAISPPYATPTNELRSPEDSLTLWQWMTVSWMASLMEIGSKRRLNDEDVWQLGYEFQHRHLHDAFRELRGTVVRRLLKANGIDLVILTFLALVELVANYSGPVLLQKLLKSMEDLQVTKRPAIIWALLSLVARLVVAQCAVFNLWFGRRCYERSRGEMITMLFEKTLNRKIIGGVNNEVQSDSDKPGQDATASSADDDEERDHQETDGLLSDRNKDTSSVRAQAARIWDRIQAFIPFRRSKEVKKPKEEPASMGKILNLMRGDVYEVSQRFWDFQTIIETPIGLVLSILLVWRLIGWPCLVGISAVLIAQGINALLARQLIRWETIRRAATDEKLRQISQYVEAIRHLRWYGWHTAWLDKILSARQKELTMKVVTNLWTLAIMFVNSLGSGLLPVASFWAYTVLGGKELRIDVIFSALQLFVMLQSNLRGVPGLITTLLNAAVAVGRLESFMAEPDKEHDKNTAQSDGPLELRDASFAWPGLSDQVLKNVTLSFPPGLTVVFGQVAAGKTALLQALLGELDLCEGELLKPNAPIAYCAQTPWLQSMSIRDNILFGSPYDDVRYKKTLDACALVADFASFKHGDLSNIGENGIGLSGGQKARTALARAVYSRANILMLDDPLSALDQQTAESIVAKCIAGELLRNRTVILVTHRTDLCQGLATQAVQVCDGTARVVGNAHFMTEESNTTPSLDEATNGNLIDEPDKTLEDAAVPDKFIDEEHREHGGVQAKVYWEYVKAGKFQWWALVILGAIICRLLRVVDSWFLKEWGEAYNTAGTQIWTVQQVDFLFRIRSSPVSRFFDRFPDPAVNVKPWLIGYLLLDLSQTIAYVVMEMFLLLLTYTAGRKMFNAIMRRVGSATFRFYDVTPVGRLMNRLTSDVGTIDGNISDRLLYATWQAIAWVTAVVVIASITPIFLILAVVLSAMFVLVFMRFIPTSQSLRRLEMVSLSPLMSNFGALLEGLTTVRAFCVQEQFQERVLTVTDSFQKMDHFYWSLHAWLIYRFDILSGLSTFIMTLLAVYSGLSSGLTAFVLITAGSFVRATHDLCKQYGSIQLEFVSVERVVELMHLEQEPAGDIDPPAWWPSYESDVVFEDVTIRYAPHLEPALSGVSFCLKGGSNTAVIGRTGSGKSTLALALLSTITPEAGRILVGGIDIAKANKQALRTRVTFLAQDPVLFPGSLRHNLDPTEEHSDAACEAAIARVCGAYDWKLDTQIDAGGKNLSQGQRQLVGLARAILRRSAIVIMDEATASIDKETAWEIQRVLREEMTSSTVITIAHRPSAVRGADYCLALGNGKVIGVGSPDEVGEMVFGQTNVNSDGEDVI